LYHHKVLDGYTIMISQVWTLEIQIHYMTPVEAEEDQNSLYYTPDWGGTSAALFDTPDISANI
jgi:hypothetical protein